MFPGRIGTHRVKPFVCLAIVVLATLLIPLAAAQAPTTSISLSGTPGNNGWYRSDVTITLSATDYSGLGINRTEYSFNGNETSWIRYTGPFNMTKEDMTRLYVRSVDNGSMIGAESLLVSIDKTPPAISYVLTPAPNANGWTTQNVHLHFDVSDEVSGVADWPGDRNLTNEGLYDTLSGTATDKAGNSVTIKIPPFGIDRTPPVVGNLTMQSNAYVGDYMPVSAYVMEVNPQRMEWDFGDGTGSAVTVKDNVARTSHAYKQPGVYQITLDVTDKAGQTAKSSALVTIYGTVPTAQVTVTPTPAPTATPTPTPVPLPSPTVTPKPAPALSFLLASLALVGGALVLAVTRKK